MSPPRYLALLGITPATCGGGHTSFADGYAMVATFSQEQQRQLKQKIIAFPTADSQGVMGNSKVHAPVLEVSPHQPPILRFSYNLFYYSDYNAPTSEGYCGNLSMEAMLEQSKRYYQKEATSLQIGAGELLILDNYRMLHARSRFQDPHRRLEVAWLK